VLATLKELTMKTVDFIIEWVLPPIGLVAIVALWAAAGGAL
jgi:hypothetical protein